MVRRKQKTAFNGAMCPAEARFLISRSRTRDRPASLCFRGARGRSRIIYPTGLCFGSKGACHRPAIRARDSPSPDLGRSSAVKADSQVLNDRTTRGHAWFAQALSAVGNSVGFFFLPCCPRGVGQRPRGGTHYLCARQNAAPVFPEAAFLRKEPTQRMFKRPSLVFHPGAGFFADGPRETAKNPAGDYQRWEKTKTDGPATAQEKTQGPFPTFCRGKIIGAAREWKRGGRHCLPPTPDRLA